MENNQTTSAPEAPGEILINRTITFRNSTFGGLKSFIRAHQRKKGVLLTNAAAVDLILRSYLSRHLHSDAVAEMMSGSRPEAVRHLRELPHEEHGDGPADALEGPSRVPKIILKATPRDATKSSRRPGNQCCYKKRTKIPPQHGCGNSMNQPTPNTRMPWFSVVVEGSCRQGFASILGRAGLPGGCPAGNRFRGGLPLAPRTRTAATQGHARLMGRHMYEDLACLRPAFI
jgi:hypothetical protein